MTGSPDFAQRLEDSLEGVPGVELTARATRISEQYRSNTASSATIRDEIDAAIYALMRLPATGRAVEHVLTALSGRAPDFAPATILDVGAGPGTASFVAAEFWPDARLELRDAHPGFLALAQKLTASEGLDARVRAADITTSVAFGEAADLVIASYALTEISDAGYLDVASRLWASTAGMLVIVEPGRPRDYRRLMAFRDQAIGQGAVPVAPCPHAQPCPLSSDDWCHFGVRLPRGRTHKRLKSAALGYEDEKFSYLVLMRPDEVLQPAQPRVIAPPHSAKPGVALRLCMPNGSSGDHTIARRNAHHKRAKKLRWGDAVPADWLTD